MLTHLTVKDVALVDYLELDFESGMTVITGETGAGKSIMLDALGLALGDRAETGLIAHNAERAEINATFDLSGSESAMEWLADRALDSSESECILRRVVSKDGRSRGFINGSPVTVTDLKALGEMLIDIHSQHEHQSLLKRDTHRRLVDEFAKETTLAKKVTQLSEKYQETRSEMMMLIESNDEKSSRLQLLTYQAEELEQLGTTETEAFELENEQKLLSGAESILSAGNEASSRLSEGDGETTLDGLTYAMGLLSKIDQPKIRTIIDMLESSRIQVEEASHDLARFLNEVELDPARLRDVEARLTEIYDAARKHRVSPNQLPTLLEHISLEIEKLGGAEAEIDRLQNVIDEISAEYEKAAGKLSKTRAKAAKRLSQLVNEKLASLGMDGARFEIALVAREKGDPSSNGLEDIEFLISTNPGADPRPLGRIASGGELSRISLAIQVVTADTSSVPTLIFDEVDVGIGGAIAEVVGSLLRHLGTKAQIVCVTHLAQVAAQGHHHFLVTKVSDKKHATTEINPLPNEEKVTEIARMLGGIDVTDQSLAHAREMYSAAQR